MNYKKNGFITAPKVLLIDELGEKLGEVDIEYALKMARDKGLDLIEVSPHAKPPVTKILPWSKFKYEQEKKRKEQKTKSSSLKEMWFKPFIGDKDLEHKLKKVQEFIKKKSSVKLTIRARGRVQRQHLKDLMTKILKIIEEYAEPQGYPKFQGRNLGTIVIPRKTKLVKEETQEVKKTAKATADDLKTKEAKKDEVKVEKKSETKVEEKPKTKVEEKTKTDKK